MEAVIVYELSALGYGPFFAQQLPSSDGGAVIPARVAAEHRGAYEVWSGRGMVRFQRLLRDDGALAFEIIEQIGENPIQRQDHRAVASIAEELTASARSGHPTEDPDRAFVEPAEVTYPHAYERIAQLFDSPNAPDLILGNMIRPNPDRDEDLPANDEPECKDPEGGRHE